MDGPKLAAARLWASSRMPYLATAIFAAQPTPAPESATISVDGAWRLHVDPEVLDTLTVEETGRLILHLCGHLIRDHGTRAQRLGVAPGSGAGRWNRAADAELNDDLEASELAPALTATELPRDLGCETGRLAEAYWEHGREGPRRWDCGSGADGAQRPWDGDGPDGPPGLDELQGELLRQAVAAEVQSQPPGTVPGGWLRWAESVRPSRVDWRRLLAAELRRAVAHAAGMVDYSYRRPSRRSLPGVVLPVLQRPVPEVAVVVDTSASMHEALLERALGEVDGVLRRAGLRTGARVLSVDTRVHTSRRVSAVGQVQLAGGGGTDMGAGIAAAAALSPRPSTIIVLTDGYTPWPDRPPPGIRVIAGILAQGRQAPAAPSWARTVVIEE